MTMKGYPFAHPGLVLIAGNAILAFVFCLILTTNRTTMDTAPPTLPVSAIAKKVAPAFGRVTEQTDRAAARLFSLPLTTTSGTITPAEVAPLPDPIMRLVGVIWVEGTNDEPIALIGYGEPARIARLRMGNRLAPLGWRLERISSSAVEVVRNGERRILKLD